jgi:antitoxin component YwqK of YwqJK toxin-antitoxin module
MKTIILFTLLFLSTSFTEKEYLKNHYPNGKIREEGWIVDGKKNEYWFYYYENGFKKEEGHYRNDQKINWWIYYDKNQTIVKKCEYKNNVLNGLVLIYKNGEIVFAEKYNMGQKIKSWNTLSEFKKDNN